MTELLLELYVVSDGAFAARTVRQALQHGADLSLGGFDLGMERAGGDAQRPVAEDDELLKIVRVDALTVDAQLLAIILADTPVDACLGDLMKLEATTADYLQQSVPGFDMEAPHYWANKVLTDGVTAAELTVSEPALIGWLHTLEAISQLCMASARYRAAVNYSRRVLKAEGYPTRAAGTVLLALARLEDEDGFFALAHQLEEQMGADALENSPW